MHQQIYYSKFVDSFIYTFVYICWRDLQMNLIRTSHQFTIQGINPHRTLFPSIDLIGCLTNQISLLIKNIRKQSSYFKVNFNFLTSRMRTYSAIKNTHKQNQEVRNCKLFEKKTVSNRYQCYIPQQSAANHMTMRLYALSRMELK